MTFIMVLALGAFFSFTTTTFFNARNLSQVFRDAAYVGLISVGMSVVMISGNIDLSGGGVVCLSGGIVNVVKLVFRAQGILLNIHGVVTVEGVSQIIQINGGNGVPLRKTAVQINRGRRGSCRNGTGTLEFADIMCRLEIEVIITETGID